MSEGKKNIILILIGLLFLGYLLFTGIADLVNTKDVHTFHADYAVGALDVEHSINGIIPIGTDHFFLAVNAQTGESCFVKASKSWLGKNFAEDGTALAAGGIDIKALAKSQEFKVERELESRAATLTGAGTQFVVSPATPLDLGYKLNAILRIVLAFLSVALVFTIYKVSKAEQEVSLLTKRIILVISIVFLVVLLIVIS